MHPINNKLYIIYQQKIPKYENNNLEIKKKFIKGHTTQLKYHSENPGLHWPHNTLPSTLLLPHLLFPSHFPFLQKYK